MMNDKAKSSTVAKDLLDYADKNGEDDYGARASVLLAQIEIDNQNPAEAKGYFQSAADKAGTSEDRCAAYLNLAALFAQEGNNQRALEAFRKAESASRTYRTLYKARMGQARMLCKLGAYEESLSLLRDLLSNTNYREYFGEISFEIGNVFKESKDYRSAIAQYTYVDTSYARTETAANSYFQLGDLYETRLFQFDSARVYYTRGRMEFPQAAVSPQLARRSDYTAKYVQLRNEVRRLDSLREVLLQPPDTTHLQVAATIDSTVDTLHGKRPDSTLARTHAAPPLPLDSVNARLAYNETELAALFFTSMNLPDSAEKWYRGLLIEFPMSPQAPRALFTLAQIYSLDSTRSHTANDSLYRMIADRFPDSEFAPEAERLLGRPVRIKEADPAEASYARAEMLLDSGDTRGARDTMRVIVANYPSSPVASKAQYALGWIYENASDQSDSALSSYRKLVQLYPRSRYAPLVKPKIDEYDNMQKALEQKMKDSLSAAQRDTLHNIKPLEQKMKDTLATGVRDSLRLKPVETDTLKRKPPDQVSPDTLVTPPKKEKE